MVQLTRDVILTTLVAEALDDPDTGWLSDLGVDGYYLEYDLSNETITIDSPEHVGSIDVGQLAGVIEALVGDAAS